MRTYRLFHRPRSDGLAQRSPFHRPHLVIFAFCPYVFSDWLPGPYPSLSHSLPLARAGIRSQLWCKQAIQHYKTNKTIVNKFKKEGQYDTYSQINSEKTQPKKPCSSFMDLSSVTISFLTVGLFVLGVLGSWSSVISLAWRGLDYVELWDFLGFKSSS